MERQKNVSSSSSGSITDSGIEFQKIKKDRGTGLAKGNLNFPLDGISPPLPEKDNYSRTRHLSHLPNAKPATIIPTSRTKSHSRSQPHSFSISTPPATLVKLLRAQESTTKETKALLNAALSQLDTASARATKAEAQLYARETTSLLSHTQLTEHAARAEEAASRARREAERYKQQLWWKEEEIRKEKERVKAEERLRAEAEKEAERARSLARKWRGEGRMLKAREAGRLEGFDEGLKRGRLVIAAALNASDPGYRDRRLVGDGAAYIEEYNEEQPNQARRRKEQSRSRNARSRRTKPSSSAPPSRRERDELSTQPPPSELVQPEPRPLPEPAHEPPLPPPSIPDSNATLRRARSIQTDPSLIQPERTRSHTSTRSSRSGQLQTVAPSPPVTYSSHHSSQPPVIVHESPPPPPPSPPPPVFPEPAPTMPEPEFYAFPPSDALPNSEPQQQQTDPSPIPIPLPISQVPFAPGILPPDPSMLQHGEFTFPEPEPEPPVQPTYFPMPAPPVRVIVTPAEEDRDVQTPSTVTSMTNEHSLKGLDSLRNFPAVTSRAGSAASAGSGGSAGPSRILGGGFDPDLLSTIHEHSREGTAFGEEDFGSVKGMSPRNVEEWRRSLGGTYSPADDSGNNLLRPPSSNSNSRRRRPPPLDLDADLSRQLSSGSTSSRSININIEPPSHPGSPSNHREHQNVHSHPRSQDYRYSYTTNENPPQDDAFLSPHHAPLTLSAEPDEVPVIPRIKEESEDDEEYDDYDSKSFDQQTYSTAQMYPIPIVDSLPPGFMPTPGGGHLVPLKRQSQGGTVSAQMASVGYISGSGVTGQSRGVPGGFYAHANNTDSQNPRAPYNASSIRHNSDGYSRRRSSGSSSHSGSTTGSTSSSGTEMTRPMKYSRSKSAASSRRTSDGLTSTFPPTLMSDGGYDSNNDGHINGNSLGGIYAMPPNNQNNVNRTMMRNMSQYGSVGTVPAAAAIGHRSRMPASMPEPSVPQYGLDTMPEPSVPQYPYNSSNARYSTREDPSTMVSMPEPAVPLYPSAGSANSSLDGQRNVVAGVGGRQRSLKRSKGNVSRVGMEMPEPSVPQYPTSNTRGYGTQTPGRDANGGSRVTAANVSMPEPSVHQYNTPNQGHAAAYQTPGGSSRMIPPAMSMPEPGAMEYPQNAYQTPGGGSRMIPPAMSMPEPTVNGYSSNVYQTPGASNTSSRMTPAVVSMPEPNVPPQHEHREPYTHYQTQTPGGGTAGASRMVPPAISMPEPSVGPSKLTGTSTPASVASRITAPAISMPEPSVGSNATANTTPAGGTSRMTAPVMPMPEPSLGPTANGTAAGRSRMTAPMVPMPEPSVGSNVSHTPAGETNSRMTVPVLSMPEPSVGTSTLTGTPSGGTSRMTAPVIPMPEPSLGRSDVSPLATEPGSQMPGSFTPGQSSSASVPRFIPPGVSMPEPTVPQYNSAATPQNTVSMPEPSVPQFGINGGSSPAGGSLSRITAPAVPMPEPNVPQVIPQEVVAPPADGESRMTAPAMSMPEPAVSAKPLTKAQKKKQKKKGGISMPEPEVPQYDIPSTAGAGGSSVVTMPEPSVPSYDTQSTTPGGGSSRMIPPTIPMPEPSSNVTAPVVPMPVPSIGTPSLSIGGSMLPPSSPAMSASGWGLGSSSGWGFDGAAGSGGPNTPNMSNHRMSMHAGTTPVTETQPLPVPNPISGPLRKGLGMGSSSTSSVDSTTRRNTEANKGSKKSARARGMTSAWGN
ncbi:hypothetical protein FB446DRAFT_793322 [Lentinula raphanica]|nr:hypothetical protein FB446DRAFT_793322 [Lentinula raphanica]